MSHILVNTLAVAVVLGVIVFVHELGHFLAAKMFGVRVETFSLGFGKRLLGYKYGDTDYRLSLLPIGGYVKMAGENPIEERQGNADEFLSKPRWQRFVIAIAGPFMNAVLAIGLLVPVYMHEYPRDSILDQPAVVATVDTASPAAVAGIQPGDRIIRFDGINNPTWEDVLLHSAVSADHTVAVSVLRNGNVVDTRLKPVSAGSDQEPKTGLAAAEPTVLGALQGGEPAAKSGLQAGDLVVAVNGAKVMNPADLIQRIQDSQPPLDAAKVGSAGRPVTLTVQRRNATLDFTPTPNLETNQGKDQWMIGAGFRDTTVMVQLPFKSALQHSLADNKQYSMLILDLVGKLVSHQASISNLQSPIGIASLTGDAARQTSMLPLYSVTSMISLNLGILNLLPIPVLDGGMILFLFIEALLRHEISLRIKERVYQAGFAFLLLIMTVAVYNDIIRAVVTRH